MSGIQQPAARVCPSAEQRGVGACQTDILRELAKYSSLPIAAQPIAASVTLLSACLDDQLAYETDGAPKGGLFSRAVLAALAATPGVSEAKFVAPVRREQADREEFSISMRVAGGAARGG